MEDKKEMKKGEPLLYIHQPDFVKPDLNMQDMYKTEEKEEEDESTKKEKVNSNLNESNSNQHIKPDDVESHQEEKNLEKEKNEQLEAPKFPIKQMHKKNVGGMKKVKSFREMDIEEKLRYLSSFPENQPPYPCEFVTNNQRYQGIVISLNNEQASIKTFSDAVIDIMVSDVKAIRIIR
ncbi:CotO family spore coat protein [Lederbergia lenta]|uniref:CotO n=1 Tax=Lederbergia lenta TaxID=1467 RepID=A0A2X4WMD3_LEDLE|nr:CotO family spore coat protein [Lederbergia lenta]MCM3110437.1 spore coat CotO family protein [Lederbergia lenta]MEC2323997.1 CotO family spore coat protein [Lederbergia lenta]SQI60858.1 CotO [Lederbergia lenta]